MFENFLLASIVTQMYFYVWQTICITFGEKKTHTRTHAHTHTHVLIQNFTNNRTLLAEKYTLPMIDIVNGVMNFSNESPLKSASAAISVFYVNKHALLSRQRSS